MSSSINNVFIEGSEGGIDSGAKKVLDSTQVQAHQRPKTVTLKLGGIPSGGTKLVIMPTQQPQAGQVLVATTSAPIVVHSTVTQGQPAAATSDATVKKKRAPRKKKDPNAPAAPSSAYTLFFRDTQATIKSQNPGAKFGDISKIVASMWEALGEDEKAKYKRLNEEDKIRYQREMESYKAGVVSSHIPDEIVDEDTKEVFSSNETTTPILSQVRNQQHEEEKTENMCIKKDCQNVAIKSPEWDDEYCCDECAVGHCKDVFASWVSEQSG